MLEEVFLVEAWPRYPATTLYTSPRVVEDKGVAGHPADVVNGQGRESFVSRFHAHSVDAAAQEDAQTDLLVCGEVTPARFGSEPVVYDEASRRLDGFREVARRSGRAGTGSGSLSGVVAGSGRAGGRLSWRTVIPEFLACSGSDDDLPGFSRGSFRSVSAVSGLRT